MVAVLQVCSDSINKKLNETHRYDFTGPEIFEIVRQVTGGRILLINCTVKQCVLFIGCANFCRNSSEL